MPLRTVTAALWAASAVFCAGHLERVGERSLGLLLERGGAAVPELVGAVGAVDHRRGAPAALLLADPERDLRAVGERLLGGVATGAGDALVGGEPVVEVEQPAELGLRGASTGCPRASRSAGRPSGGRRALRRLGGAGGRGGGAGAGPPRRASAEAARVAVRGVTAMSAGFRGCETVEADGRAGPVAVARRGPRGVGIDVGATGAGVTSWRGSPGRRGPSGPRPR